MGPAAGGLEFLAFAGMWTLMMTAMMVPSAVPVALRYARTIGRRRGVRLLVFAAGYVAVWSITAIPGYGLALMIDRASSAGATAATAMASTMLATCGAYQLSGLKDRCLRVCRAPFGLLLRYAAWRGPLRDLRVSVHHGGFCVACCWALMALMAVFGAMSVVAMAALAGVVAVEKLASGGHRFARGVGVVALVLAVAVWWLPGLAPGAPDAAPGAHPHGMTM